MICYNHIFLVLTFGPFKCFFLLMLSITHSIPGFVDSDESSALDRLIETYQDREEEEFHECCDSAVFKAMDNEV